MTTTEKKIHCENDFNYSVGLCGESRGSNGVILTFPKFDRLIDKAKCAKCICAMADIDGEEIK